MNYNKSLTLFLLLVLALILSTSLFADCNNVTATTTANIDTFSDYAAKGQTAHNSNCTRCHGNFGLQVQMPPKPFPHTTMPRHCLIK